MTVSITATQQDVFPPRVQIAVTGLTVGTAIEVYRSVGGQRTLVRAGSDPNLADTSFVRVDAELPFGVPVTYVAVVTGEGAINANPYFESDVADWSGSNGATIAASTVQQHQGLQSMSVTPDGSTANTLAASTAVAVTAGSTYASAAWVWPTAAGTYLCGLAWYDGDDTLLDTSETSASLESGAWTQIPGSDAAPTDTATATVFVRASGTLGAGDVFYVDEAQLLDPNGSAEYSTTATTYTLPGGKVVLTDAISGLAAEVVITAWPDKPRARQSSAFVAGGRNVAVLGDLAGFSGTVDVYMETTSAVDNLDALLANATSGTIQIRQAGGYDGVDCYVAVMGATEHRFSQDGSDERRTVSLEVLQNDGWAPALEARGFTYGDVEDAYDGLTYADAEGDFATYLDAMLADWS